MLSCLFYMVEKPQLLESSIVSFYIAWNSATNHNAYVMIGLDVITYSRIVIIDMYNVRFTSEYSSNFLNLQTVIMGFLTGAQYSIMNFFNISFIYLVSEMNIPLSMWEICKPRKNDNSLRIYMSNSFCISIANSLHIFFMLLKKLMTSQQSTFFLLLFTCRHYYDQG